jgi:tRNA-Thr(GGU) m(6)t(6)A37 methyltransferase TsaA
MTFSNFSPIGIISSCYKEKFGIPRQPNLVPAATAQLVLNKEFGEESIRGLEGFSHLWVNFIFHQTQGQGWKPMVRPPRLGGNKKVGVFASRSTFRPNSLGLSVVELLDCEITENGVVLHLRGCDLLDGTPVLDIKPYLPYVDSIPNAKGGFAKDKPEVLYEVLFTEEAELQCELVNQRLRSLQNVEKQGGWTIKNLIKQLLELDPRPSYQNSSNTKGNKESNDRIYAMKLYDFDLKWQYTDDNKIKVIGLITQG